MTFQSSVRLVLGLLPGLLLSVTGLHAQSCSTSAAAGEYVLVCDGFVATSSTSPLVPTKVLSTATATAGGTFTGSGTVSLGGKLVSSTISGTGSISSNCTGSVALSQTLGNQTGPTLNANLVVSNNGNTIDALVTNPMTVLSCELKRISSPSVASNVQPVRPQGRTENAVAAKDSSERLERMLLAAAKDLR